MPISQQVLVNLESDLALCIVCGIFRTLSIIVNSDIFRRTHNLFRHDQPYRGIFRTLYNSCIFRTLPCSKSWHIYNQEIFRTLSRHIQNPGSLGIFMPIQAYSVMIVIYYLVIYYTLSLMIFDYNDVNFNARLSLFK